MNQLFEHVKTLNAVARTAIALLVLGLLSLGSWTGYQFYTANDQAAREQAQALADAQQEIAQARETIREQTEAIAAREADIQRLNTALRLLKVDQRVARLSILSQRTDPETGLTINQVRFQELVPDGHPTPEPLDLEIPGTQIYLEYWVAKFKDEFVEQADLVRGTSICLFRRIFSDEIKAKEGWTVDVPGERPVVYADGTPKSAFEQRIWDRFWEISADSALAEQYSVRAAHGSAPFIQPKPGQRWLIELRASDGLSIKPEEPLPTKEIPVPTPSP